MKSTILKAVSLVAAVGGCLGVLCSPAFAGSYVLSACSPTTSAGLWAPTNTFPAALATGNQCGGPAIGPTDGSHQGALYAEDILNSPANIPDGSRAGWTFNAPAGTTITAISYYRTLTSYLQSNVISGLFQADGSPLEQCKIPWPFPSGSSIHCDKINDQAPVTFTGLNTSSLFLGVMCRIVDGSSCIAGGAPLHAAKADLYSARVTLSESGAPTLSNVGGPLWGRGVVWGVVPVTFAASDPSGIKEQLVRSDSGQTLNSALQPCDFTSMPPCPQQPAGSLHVDTTRVPDGPRTFSLVVSDAAGNSQLAASPPVVVDNHGPPPPTLTATAQGTVPGQPRATPGRRTKVAAVINGRRLRVSGTIIRTGRVRVSWRSRLRGRTLGAGSRVVRVRKNKIALTFTLSSRARTGTTRIAVRSGRRILAQARARAR
jgi:hypothetical protein